MACIRAQNPKSDIQHVMGYLTCDNRTGPKLSGPAAVSACVLSMKAFDKKPRPAACQVDLHPRQAHGKETCVANPMRSTLLHVPVSPLRTRDTCSHTVYIALY